MVKREQRKTKSPRRLFYFIVCAWFFAAASATCPAQFKAWVMAKLPDTPEGLGVDSHGNLCATALLAGHILWYQKLSPNPSRLLKSKACASQEITLRTVGNGTFATLLHEPGTA
jgi:hypothetical protein